MSSQNKSQCRIKSHRAMLTLGAPVQSSGHTGKSRFHSQNVVLQEPNLMVEIFYVLLPQRNSLEVLKNRSMEVPLYHKGKKKKCISPSRSCSARAGTAGALFSIGVHTGGS